MMECMDQTPQVIIEKKISKKLIGLIIIIIGCVLTAVSVFLYLSQIKGKGTSYHFETSIVSAEQPLDWSKYHPPTYESKYNQSFDVSASAYGVMDRDSHEILFAKNIKTIYPVASLTKMMTVLIALEYAPIDTLVTISPQAEKIGEATMGLSAGERLTIEELIYGAMLPSGNDAAEALSEGVGLYYQSTHKMDLDRGKARQWFIQQMNRKAKALGMADTSFFNPTGLDEDTLEESDTSTVYDYIALTMYALENPTFAKVVATDEIVFPYKQNYHKAFFLYNILGLSRSYEGIKGVKPGNSIFAKETLVSYIERSGKRLIAVLLASERTKDDVLQIYKTIFDSSTLSADKVTGQVSF